MTVNMAVIMPGLHKRQSGDAEPASALDNGPPYGIKRDGILSLPPHLDDGDVGDNNVGDSPSK